MARKLALALVAALLAGAASASIVTAHSRPVRFSVAPGAVFTSAPQQISGWFTAELRQDPNWTFLQVSDAQGNRVDTGAATLSSNRLQMTVNLRPGLGEGRYVVTWRTFDDADGAIFGDCFVFFVGQAAADQAVTEKARLDGGSNCARIDVSAREGTPAPGATPAGEHAEAEATSGESHSDGDSDVPVWTLIAGIGIAAVAGGIGGRILGSRS